MVDVTVDNTDIDDEKCKKYKRKSTKECDKDQPNQKKINKWMTKTFPTRRNWIITETPAATKILEEYPVFKRSQSVIHAYLSLIQIIMTCNINFISANL